MQSFVDRNKLEADGKPRPSRVVRRKEEKELIMWAAYEDLLLPCADTLTEQLEQWILAHRRGQFTLESGCAAARQEIRVVLSFDFIQLLQRNVTLAQEFVCHVEGVACMEVTRPVCLSHIGVAGPQ